MRNIRDIVIPDLEKFVKDLEGMQVHWKSLGGTEILGYVAKADLSKGITIMGEIPKDRLWAFDVPQDQEGVDYILECYPVKSGTDMEDFRQYAILIWQDNLSTAKREQITSPADLVRLCPFN